jgi:hypothetical protein
MHRISRVVSDLVGMRRHNNNNNNEDEEEEEVRII